MVSRGWLLGTLLALGCGGGAEGAQEAPGGASGAPMAAGAGSQAGAAVGGAESGGQPAVAGSTTGGAGAQQGGQAGAAIAGESSGGKNGGAPGLGGAPTGGSGGAPSGGMGGSSAGAGGKTDGGSGGKPSEPLEPQPLPGCPGYVKVFVPKGTCVWVHGTFTQQSETCSVANPHENKCATASAVSGDTSIIVSAGASVEHFDFDASGCPKKCT